jgi:hypothetical protein
MPDPLALSSTDERSLHEGREMFIFSKHYWRMLKTDLPVSEAIEALLEGDAATRNTACGRLEWMAEDKTIPDMYVGDLITALKREGNQECKAI